MKKILVFLVAVIACCTVSQAQQGQSAVGVYLNYGNETNVGLGLKYRYSFNDNWRIEPAFDYYFKHDYVSFGIWVPMCIMFSTRRRLFIFIPWPVCTMRMRRLI